ncbi:MAG: D-aminoacyl-tRNA deacylase [Nitrososphaerales archaeon]
MTENLLLASSDRDIASSNMAQHLIEKHGFEETSERFEGNPICRKGGIRLVQTSKELLHLEEPKFNPEAYIFLSRHRSESGIPTLTAHFPGNFPDEASYGGRPRELGYTYPSLHREYLRRLKQLQDRVPGYKIVTEPMHHGPTSFSRPVLFVEIGSSKEQWQDQAAVETVCEAVMKTVRNRYSAEKISLGFGGTHYSEKFTKLIVESEHALGAIMPKYALQHLDRSTLHQMITKSVEKVSHAVLDWKGVKDRGKILSLVEDAGLEVVKI